MSYFVTFVNVVIFGFLYFFVSTKSGQVEKTSAHLAEDSQEFGRVWESVGSGGAPSLTSFWNSLRNSLRNPGAQYDSTTVRQYDSTTVRVYIIYKIYKNVKVVKCIKFTNYDMCNLYITK